MNPAKKLALGPGNSLFRVEPYCGRESQTSFAEPRRFGSFTKMSKVEDASGHCCLEKDAARQHAASLNVE